MKKKFQKWISMLLSAVLCIQMIPSVTVHTHAASEDRTFSKSTAIGDGFELQDGRSYLLVVETIDDSGASVYHTLDPDYLASGSVNTLEIYPEADGTFLVNDSNPDVPVLTYRSGTNVSGLYLNDGRMLYWDTNSQYASIISADEAAALEDYRIFWWGMSDSDSAGVLYATPSSGDAYFVYGLDASTQETEEMFYVDSSVAPNVTYYYLYEGPCPHTDAFLYDIYSRPATCTEPGMLPVWRCPTCDTYFTDESLSEPLEHDPYIYNDAIIYDAAIGHNFVDGECVNCGSRNSVYNRVTSMEQLQILESELETTEHKTTFILVANVGDTLYAMGMSSVDDPDLAFVPITANFDGSISANGLDVAQFEVVQLYDYDNYESYYALRLPNHWIGPNSELCPRSDEYSEIGDENYHWNVMFYDSYTEYFDPATKTSTTLGEYMAENSDVTDLGRGAVLIYNRYTGDPAQSMRLQVNGDSAFMISGENLDAIGTEYALWLYAADDHSKSEGPHDWYTDYVDGLHINQCGCGAYIETAEHSWMAEISDPTCTEDGMAWLFCEGCYESYNEDGVVIPATGHNWTQWYVMQEPNREEGGMEIRYCLNGCYDEVTGGTLSETRIIPYIGHEHTLQYVEKIPATCQEGGVEAYYVCTSPDPTGGDNEWYCEGLYTDAEGTNRVMYEDLLIPVQDHDWSEWVDVDTTNEAYKMQNRTCSVCQDMERRQAPADGHVHPALTYVEYVAPSCFVEGHTGYYVCDYQGTSDLDSGCQCYFADEAGTIQIDLADTVIPADGHTWSEWVAYEYGHERECLVCHHYQYVEHILSPYADNSPVESECHQICLVEGCEYAVVNEKGHVLEYWIADDSGKQHYQLCPECGYTVYADHEFGEWTLVNYASGESAHWRDCPICYDSEYSEDHIWIESENVPPSCSEAGSITYVCDAENCDGTMTEEIPATGHSITTWVETFPPACETGGTEEGTCDVCGEYTESREIPSTGHSYSIVEIPSTCTVQGYTSHTCEICGYNYISDYAPLAEHSYTSVVTPPTCTEQGYTTHTCSVCGDNYVDTYVAASGHTMGEWQQTAAPGCLTNGTEIRSCANCDYTETQEVAGYAHKYDIVVTPPTCTEQGYTTNICSLCGDNYVDTYVAAPGHTMGEWQQTEAPGCETTGTETRTCANCDYTETQTVAASGHKYGSVVTPPTCTAQGYTTHTCSVCGNSYIDTYVEATGHTMGDWQQTAAPGCETTGTETRTCANCDYTETQTVAARDHNYGEVVTPPTCTAQGYTTHTCSSCGDSYIDTYVEAVGHSMGDWVETVVPTYEQNGEERSDCANCDYYETRVVAALSHSYTSVVTPPTCTAQGYTTYTCSDCGDVYQENFIPALGHSYTESVTAPTCDEAGYTTYICSACGDSYVGSYVSAIGHNLGDWIMITVPTQIKDGMQARYCANGCGYTEECVVPAYGHTHHLVLVPGKGATCLETGYIAYYKCEYEEIQVDTDPDEATLNMSCSGLYILPDGVEFVSEDDLILVSEKDIIIPVADHEMGEWVTVPDKGTEDFTVQTRICRVEGCGYSESRTLPGSGHTHNMTLIKGVTPGCFTNGNITYFICEDCGNAYADAQGSEILNREDLILPAEGHKWTAWAPAASGHQRSCSVCNNVQSEAHAYSHTTGTEDTCVLICIICDHETDFGAHSFAAFWSPCDDRWQHQKACNNGCGYAMIEDHSFGGWNYSTVHSRSCECGATETTRNHIWDEGTLSGTRTIFHCIASGCGGVKEEYLRCFHTCSTCGKCTADVTCHDKDQCTCATPDPLPLVEPDIILNTAQQPFLGDIIIRDGNAPLDPDAAPGQEIPEEYAGYRVEIKEIPLNVDDACDNPYTQYVVQTLDGYEPVYMFDIHLLNGDGEIVYSAENEQYLIKLYLETEIVEDIRDGLIRLAHVTEEGTTFYGVGGGEDVLPFYKLEGNMAWFWADSFSPFALVQPEAPYFGRNALAKMDNKDNLLYAYDALVAGVEACEAKIQLYAETPSITIDEARMVMDAYTRDHTEHFWLESKYSITYQKDTVFAKHIKPTYSMTGEALAQAQETFNAAVDELLKGITEVSEFDRQLILHDRLAAQVTYDYSFSEPDIYNAYGAIVRGKAVCQGYSEALQYLLRRVGIQSFIVTGFSNDVSHAWNQVRVDNEYYHTDLTWNDQESRLYHAYFNMNDSYITEDHEIYVTAYPTVECAEMSANYFTVKDLTRENGDVSDIAKLLKENNYKISIMLTGDTSAKDFTDWFTANYRAIVQEAGITEVISCSYGRLGREAVIDMTVNAPVVPDEPEIPDEPEVPDEPEEPENQEPSVSVTAEKSAGTVSVTASCTGSMSGYLMIAVYNGSNKMLGIKVIEESKLRGGSYSISISRSETPVYVKAFVLDSDFKPILPEATYVIP